jgi:hypothetical protein
MTKFKIATMSALTLSFAALSACDSSSSPSPASPSQDSQSYQNETLATPNGDKLHQEAFEKMTA